MTFLRAQFYLPSLFLLCGVVFCFWLLSALGYRTDDLQTLAFPIVLLSVWRLPKNERFCVPVPILFGAVCVWAFGGLNVRGFLPDTFLEEGIYLTRLNPDPEGLLAENFSWHYNQVGVERGYVPLRTMEWRFQSEENLSRWVRSRSKVLLALHGSPDWLRMVFPPAKRTFRAHDIPPTEESRQLLKEYGLTHGDQVLLVQPGGLPTPLVFVAFPESVSLPVKPIGITRNFLGLLGQGLRQGRAQVNESDLGLRRRVVDLQRATFLVASSVEGPWKTHEPRGLAQLLAGNIDLLSFVESQATESTFLSCARYNFHRAATRLQARYAPQLVAAVYNNLGISLVNEAYNRHDFRSVRSVFLDALRLKDERGAPVRGARAALVNLVLLERAGLF